MRVAGSELPRAAKRSQAAASAAHADVLAPSVAAGYADLLEGALCPTSPDELAHPWCGGRAEKRAGRHPCWPT
ncbi:hypothetical protein HaLaN_32800 [Haematococcus lacustris]|uniref:Uncharacterized protein n=1 Tax=Haematococcus lacustris TaxID=44745 RepID=A0A6A0ALF4_HAELA|nr:hypothetical protein HaLaN_32800 [Haematococcus lacustris]